MVCEAPGEQSKKFDSSGLGQLEDLDAEHALVREVLDIIDRYYYDLKNDQGAAASAQAHTYNGNALADMRAKIDARKLPSRDATYKEIRQIIRRLDDKYSRFLGYFCTSKASKLRIYYLALYQPRHTVGYTCSSPSLFNSLRPHMYLHRHSYQTRIARYLYLHRLFKSICGFLCTYIAITHRFVHLIYLTFVQYSGVGVRTPQSDSAVGTTQTLNPKN